MSELVMVDVHLLPRNDGFPPKYKRRKVSAVRDFPKGCGRNVPKLDLGRGREESRDVPIAAADSPRLLRKGVTVARDVPSLPGSPCRQADSSNATNVHGGADTYACNGKEFSSSKIVADGNCEVGISTATNALLDAKESIPSMVVDNEQCLSKIGADENCEVGISTETNAFMDVKESIPSMVVDNDQCEAALYEVDDYQEDGMDEGRDKVPFASKESSPSIVVSDEQYLNVHDYGTTFSDDKCEKELLEMNNSDQVVVGNDLVIEEDMAREKVEKVISCFREIVSDLLRRKRLSGGKEKGSVYQRAASILGEKKWINMDRRLGPIPGVKVGDYFDRRAELNIIGLHRHFIHGIDYMELDGRILATSIVDSGRYDNSVELNDEQESREVIIYSGEGGNPKINKKIAADDQNLKRGNLALKNSADAKNPIRVLRKFFIKSASKKNMDYKFVYDGLYFVDHYREERASCGKIVFKFVLRRLPGQPKVCKVKFVGQPKLDEVKLVEREVVCWEDISQGKEKIPIRAINELDDEKPPSFCYVTNMSYPNSYHPPASSDGCDCTDGCSDSEDCLCAIKNGGEIPYNYEERIMMAKPLIIECGPSCKCFTSCINRVSQRGIRFDLEVFKTKTKGWGVRSRSFIPRGGFICEYTGKIFRDKEVEKRIGKDEYLFDIGNNYGNHSLRDAGMHSSDAGECFTIDAAQFGNVGRFINHSCSPNLFAQNVLFDHDNRSMPHIMLFAMEDIPPLEELSYDYNYKIGEVCDVSGNVKMKTCHCGSKECTGRMY